MISVKKITAVLLSAALTLFCGFTVSASAKEQAFDPLSVADGIIEWKTADNGSSSGKLINDRYLEAAGTTPGDWYVIGLSRLLKDDNYGEYLSVVRDKVRERYSESGKLSSAKATEWHRITLAVLAAGGDPTNMGTDESGQTVNLIADGTYNRGKVTSLGRQGINGWIWGLIALDSMRYAVPDGAYYTRDDIILEIVSRQLSDGGFALSGKTADPDITAMAIQALAPYYNSEKIYTFKALNEGASVSKSVYEVIDAALECLSALQLDSGGFASWGTENVESTDQVVVALCCLGIDPLEDERFIKNGNTLVDGILKFQNSDGGFVHSFTYDSDNPTSLPDTSNTMAGEQTLYTMAAIWRQSEGMRTLYDFRSEQSPVLKQRIASLENKIADCDLNNDKTAVEALLKEFYSLPEDERCYVTSYRRLSDGAKKCGIDISLIADTTVVVKDETADEDTAVLYFSESDRAEADALPTVLSSEYYVRVTALLDKIERCEDFEGIEFYREKLLAAKAAISEIEKEIDGINTEIKEKLYPFENISLKDKSTVDGLFERYRKLSDFDKAKIERWEDVVKAKTRIDNTLRGIVIGAVLALAAAAVGVFLGFRIRKRIFRRKREMEELAAMFSDEE